MSKRPSVVGAALKLAEPVSLSQPQNVPATSSRRERPDIVHTSVYLPKAVHQQLREIAFARDVKVHDVFLEGISAVLRQHGKPEVEALKRDDAKTS